MLYFYWQNFIDGLPLPLEILGNMCIAIVYFPGCDVKDFEINLIFLITFSNWPKSQEKNIFRTARAINVEYFVIFKWLSVSKNYLRPESAPSVGSFNDNFLIPSFSLSWRSPLLYRNQSIDLLGFLYDMTGFYMITAFVMKELKASIF